MEPRPDAAAPSSVPRRRNGRQQACEPCRRRKLACDHSLPSCQRCRRRNAADGCVYLIAAARSTASARAAPPDRQAPPSTTRRAAAPPQPRRSPSGAAGDGSRHESPTPMSPPTSGPDSPGYLGPTSFTAVFAEAGSQFTSPPAAAAAAQQQQQQQSAAAMGSRQGWTPPATMGPSGRSGPSTAAAEPNPSVSTAICPSRMEEYIRVLKTIPSADTCMRLSGRYAAPMDSWVRPATWHIIRSIWDAFGSELASRSRSSLAALAELLCANSQTAFDEDVHEPDEWLASFSGRNLRWESLGIAFIVLAYACSSLNNNPAEYAVLAGLDGSDAVDVRQVLLTYKECAIKCAEFCRDTGANSLLLYLSYSNGTLESMIHSDTSLRCAVMAAETAALCSYLGMHVDPAHDRADKRPSISYEARRRLFYGIMVLDKAVAIITGRPPLISRRYVSTQLPLDVTDQELMGTRSGLIKAASELDANGCSHNGIITPGKYMRVRINKALVRDEILEIALGGPNVRLSYEQLASLRGKELRQTAQLPGILVWKPDDIHDASASQIDVFAKFMLRLEHLQNMFFVERLLSRAWPSPSTQGAATAAAPPPAISTELLAVSVEIVTLIVTLWAHRDRVDGLHQNLQWLVISYAAPASGVLCMELLQLSQQQQQQQQQRQQQNSQAPRREDADPTISRSNMIMQLSLLVAFLGWTSPHAANARLCAAVKEAIQRVLNQVLDVQPPPVVAASSAASALPVASSAVDNGQSGATTHFAQHQQQQQQQHPQEFGVAGLLPQANDVGFSTDITDFLNFDLLDTFDFLRPEHAEFPSHQGDTMV